jgi:hypothetical protein
MVHLPRSEALSNSSNSQQRGLRGRWPHRDPSSNSSSRSFMPTIRKAASLCCASLSLKISQRPEALMFLIATRSLTACRRAIITYLLRQLWIIRQRERWTINIPRQQAIQYMAEELEERLLTREAYRHWTMELKLNLWPFLILSVQAMKMQAPHIILQLLKGSWRFHSSSFIMEL